MFAVSELPRLISAADATAMIGDNVPAEAPNVTSATVAVDADTKEPVFAYLPLGDVAQLRRAIVQGTTYGENMIRANGVRNRSRTFGYSPRRPVYRREGCSSTTLAREAPDAHQVICDYSDRLAELLEQIDPTLITRGRAAVEPVERDWRLGESKLWTSGVINQSAVLPWHRDAFNFPAWSAMPVLRRNIQGGHLRIAEYGATIACRDGWGVFFAGYDLIHGVTPMRLTAPDGYRYSIVYYALRGMKNCFEAAVETAYARKKRTEREQSMAARYAAGDGDVIEGRSERDPNIGAGGGLRVIGGRHQDEFDQGETRPAPRGRPEGFDPAIARKKGFRQIGGLGQNATEAERARRRAARTGDPTAIEDAYVADLEQGEAP